MSTYNTVCQQGLKFLSLVSGKDITEIKSELIKRAGTFSNVVNKLFEKGAEVIYSDIADIHVSGHACQEELKLIHSLTKPKYFMPVHGEYRHLIKHSDLAQKVGVDPKNIFISGIHMIP